MTTTICPHSCELHADTPQLCMAPVGGGVEHWKWVPGWKGRYLASNRGRILSVDRNNSRRAWRVGRILRQTVDARGYPQVRLYRDGVGYLYRVHVLVLLAFVGPCPPGMESCHNNGNPADNRLANLRWDSHGENMRDRTRHGTFRNGHTDKAACPRGHALQLPNLVPSALRLGHRACLACSRAHARVRRHPELRGELQAVADSYHRAVVGG